METLGGHAGVYVLITLEGWVVFLGTEHSALPAAARAVM